MEDNNGSDFMEEANGLVIESAADAISKRLDIYTQRINDLTDSLRYGSSYLVINAELRNILGEISDIYKQIRKSDLSLDEKEDLGKRLSDLDGKAFQIHRRLDLGAQKSQPYVRYHEKQNDLTGKEIPVSNKYISDFIALYLILSKAAETNYKNISQIQLPENPSVNQIAKITELQTKFLKISQRIQEIYNRFLTALKDRVKTKGDSTPLSEFIDSYGKKNTKNLEFSRKEYISRGIELGVYLMETFDRTPAIDQTSAEEIQNLKKELMQMSAESRSGLFLESKDMTNLYGRLEIRKGSDGYYSLLWGSKRLYYFDGQRFECLTCEKSTDPLKIEKRRIRAYSSNGGQSFEQGGFYHENGAKLPDNASQFAAHVFHQVKIGIRILPSQAQKVERKFNDEITKSTQKESNKNTLKFRHWGQQFLANPKEDVNPDRIIEGELLGSQGSYKAYIFGAITIVEFDQIKHGTYVFMTKYFETLREWNRTKILEEKPSGFIGRIIHNDNKPEEWIEPILKVLNI